jgi:hypothetical protein
VGRSANVRFGEAASDFGYSRDIRILPETDKIAAPQ